MPGRHSGSNVCSKALLVTLAVALLPHHNGTDANTSRSEEQSKHSRPRPREERQSETSSTKSTNGLNYGMACESDSECNVDRGFTCFPTNSTSSYGICLCSNERPVFLPKLRRCAIGRALHEPCISTAECRQTNPYLLCWQGACDCRPPLIVKRGKICMPERKLGSNCTSADVCSDTYSTCKNGTCVCQDEYENANGVCYRKEPYLWEGIIAWTLPIIIASIVILCFWHCRFSQPSLKVSTMPPVPGTRKTTVTADADTVSGTTAPSSPHREDMSTCADITTSAGNISRADGDVVDGVSVPDEGDLTAHLSTIDTNRGFSMSSMHSPCALPVISADVFAQRYPHLAGADTQPNGKAGFNELKDKGDESTTKTGVGAEKAMDRFQGMVSIPESKAVDGTEADADRKCRKKDETAFPKAAKIRDDRRQKKERESSSNLVAIAPSSASPSSVTSNQTAPTPKTTGSCYEVTYNLPASQRFESRAKTASFDISSPPYGAYITMKCHRPFMKIHSAVRSPTTLTEDSTVSTIEESGYSSTSTPGTGTHTMAAADLHESNEQVTGPGPGSERSNSS